MFPFKKTKPEVLEHLYALIPGFNTSTKEFYAAIEAELNERKVPGLRKSQVEYAEGGMLSDKRMYLNFARERFTFDICASPFGTAYFFSLRFGEIPAVVHLWQVVVLAGALMFGGYVSLSLCIKIFGVMGPFVWPVACLTVLFLTAYVMRNAVAMGLKDLDATLLQIPVLNAVYEAWFRADSYYRQDTRQMYMDTIKEVVKQQIEEVTGGTGIMFVKYNECSPILEGLYKTTIVRFDDKQEAAA